MGFTSYWDLLESDRAQLTREDVERYIDAELMTKGVLKVRQLDTDPELEMPRPTTAFHVVNSKARYANEPVVAFATAEQASAFLRLNPLRVTHDYMNNTSVEFAEPLKEADIVVRAVFSEDEKIRHAKELSRATAVKAENEKRREQNAKQAKAVEETLRGLWEDWAAQRTEHWRLREISETFTDYLKTAGGDAVVASRFLSKVYVPKDILASKERFTFGYVDSAWDVEAAEIAEVAAEAPAAEMAF